jgi:hypothetical protein
MTTPLVYDDYAPRVRLTTPLTIPLEYRYFKLMIKIVVKQSKLNKQQFQGM